MNQALKSSIISVFLITLSAVAFGQLPDITITDVEINSSSIARLDGIQISVTFQNQGESDINTSFWIGYQINEQNTYDTETDNSRFLVSQGLAANESTVFITHKFRITEDPGTYFLILHADDRMDIEESDENNNISTPIQFEVTADDVQLSISNLEVLPSIIEEEATSQAFEVRFNIANEGTTNIVFSGAAGHLYPSQEVDSQERIRLFSFSLLQGFDAGSSRFWTSEIEDLTEFEELIMINSGLYEVVVETEKPSSDTNLENNTATSTITIQNGRADLSISNIRFPLGSTIIPGVEYSVLYNIDNTTDYTILHSFTEKMYLSTDQLLDETDIILNETTVDTKVRANRKVGGGGLVTIPGQTTPGPYFLLVSIDEENRIEETDETNNLSFVSIKVEANSPDLSIVRFRTVAQDENGPVLDNGVFLSIKNKGLGDASAFDLDFYLSLDSEWNEEQDINIGTATFSEGLSGGATSVRTTQVEVPKETTTGSYKLIAVVDKNNEIEELNENDNIQIADGTITIAPNLSIVSFHTQSQSENEPILDNGVFLSIMNKGLSDASAFDVDIYLSLDSEWNEEQDINIGTATFSGLGEGATSDRTMQVKVPEETTAGSYKLIAIVDKNNKIEEVNENDNIQIAEETITITPVRTVLSLKSRVVGSEPIIMPNPSKEYVRISSDELAQINSVRIFSVTGKPQDVHIDYSEEWADLDVRPLAEGVYFIEILYDKNKFVTKRLIKD